MSAKIPTLGEILQLSVAERIQLVEDIWDSIGAIPEKIEITPAQHQELDRRIAEYRKNPANVIPWEIVKNRIRDAR